MLRSNSKQSGKSIYGNIWEYNRTAVMTDEHVCVCRPIYPRASPKLSLRVRQISEHVT